MPSLSEVMCNYLGLRRNYFRVMRHQSMSNLFMDLLFANAHQACICGVLNKRMLELID